MALGRGWRFVPYGSTEPDARSAPAHVELRPSDRSAELAVGTLACERCDAPILVGDHPLLPGDELTCPYCRHRGPVRDFLSLEVPARPARVVVRVRRRG